MVDYTRREGDFIPRTSPLQRFHLPALSAALLLVSLVPVCQAQGAPASSVEERRKALDGLFHQYWEENLEHSPEFASTLGDKRYNDKLTDYSVKAENAWLEREQNLMLKLAAIDPAGFSDAEKTSRELLLRRLADDEEAAEFKEWEMPVNQMGGIYSEYPQLVAQLGFTEVKDYDDWIARLRAIPKAFEQVRIKLEMLAAIGKQVLPAYTRFTRFLEASYIPAGRDEPGISALADGAKYYQFLIRRTTTTDLSAEKIHQIGLDEVKKDEADMLAIAQKLGFQDLKSFRASIKGNPKLKATSRESLLESYRGYLGPMQAKLPSLFGRLPKAPFEVAPVPDYLEKTSAPAYYEAGTPDGSRPGRLRIDTYNATDRNLYAVESIAYHEGLPGHHLQISISRELTDVPTFRKFGHFTAYSEGWGLYSERLGKDVGFYQDPYSDYGRLEADIWRAIRLGVDTGVHSEHWTRQQMVDFFHD